MRKLIGLVVVLVVLAAAASIADVIIRHQVQGDIASQIDDQLAGSHARVSISSFPFVGHLAVSGDVPELVAYVTNVDAGPVTLDTVDVTVRDLHVDRDRLYHGKVELRSLRQVTAVATISAATLDHQVGLPITLGQGTVGVDGVQVPAGLSVSGDEVHLKVPLLPQISLTIPLTNLLPCLGSAVISPGLLSVSCTTNHLPPLFQDLSTSF